MRIAVASSDGVRVDQHFGHASQFLVFDVVAGRARLMETRANIAACGADRDGLDDPMLHSVERIGDCQAVAVAKAGPCAAELLIAEGIYWIETDAPVAEALARLIARPVPRRRVPRARLAPSGARP